MLTHRNLATMASCYFIDVDAVAPADAIVYAAPMSHGCGLYHPAPAWRGARHVVPALGRLRPGRAVRARPRARRPLSFRRADHGPAPGRPRAGAAWADAAATASRPSSTAAAPMYLADIRRALAVMGPRFVQIYGQGETPMTITALSRAHLADARASALARAARLGRRRRRRRCEVRVADAQGASWPPARSARSWCAATPVMAGYWRNPEATAAGAARRLALDRRHRRPRRRRLPDAEGPQQGPASSAAAPTSTRARSRRCCCATRAWREVAVVGRAGPEWGEIVVAFVVAQPGQRRRRSDARRATASSTSRASSGPSATASSTRCRRTTTARC